MSGKFKIFRIALMFILAMVAGGMSAQNITGNVTDSSGEPIIGATIMETGTSNGTVTDIDGNFTLSNAVIPYFRGGDFSAGLRRGMFKIADTIGTEMNVELDERTKMQDNTFTEKLCMLIFFIIFVSIFVMMIRRMHNAKRTGRRYYGSSFGAMYPGHGHGRGSFGGFSSRGCGGFGGGFGGFGGGGFGGGGASRGF